MFLHKHKFLVLSVLVDIICTCTVLYVDSYIFVCNFIIYCNTKLCIMFIQRLVNTYQHVLVERETRYFLSKFA